MEYYNIGVDLLTNPKHSRWVADCLVLGETVLCALIIWKVPCKHEQLNLYRFMHSACHLPLRSLPRSRLTTVLRQTRRSTGRPTCSRCPSTSMALPTTTSSKATPARSSTQPSTSSSTRVCTTSPTPVPISSRRSASLPSCTLSRSRSSLRATGAPVPRRGCSPRSYAQSDCTVSFC